MCVILRHRNTLVQITFINSSPYVLQTINSNPIKWTDNRINSISFINNSSPIRNLIFCTLMNNDAIELSTFWEQL